MPHATSIDGSVRVDGGVLRYVCEGAGVPALVIGSAVYYPRVFSPRLREYLRLIFADTRHFATGGWASGSGELSLRTYLDDVERIRASLELDRVVLIGHSHHGSLAVEYAKRHPERVSHIVLIGSPPVDVPSTMTAAEMYWQQHASRQRKAALQDNLAAVRAEEEKGLTPEQAYVRRYVAEGPRYWYDLNYNASKLWDGVPLNMDVINVFRTFFAEGYEMRCNPDQLTAPVLVAVGRYDYAVPPTLWTARQTALPNLSLRLFEYSGHTPQLEEPHAFDEVLLDWLGRLH